MSFTSSQVRSRFEKRAPGFRRVDVVDDDHTFRWMLLQVLQEEGFEVCLHSNTRSVFPILRVSQPDLVITDVYFRGEPRGLELVKALREDPATRFMPILLTSVDGAFFRQNADLFTTFRCKGLMKPFSLSQLLDTMQELLNPYG